MEGFRKDFILKVIIEVGFLRNGNNSSRFNFFMCNNVVGVCISEVNLWLFWIILVKMRCNFFVKRERIYIMYF